MRKRWGRKWGRGSSDCNCKNNKEEVNTLSCLGVVAGVTEAGAEAGAAVWEFLYAP